MTNGTADDFTEPSIRHQVASLLRGAGLWQPNLDLLSYMGIARAAVPVNGHRQIITYRLPLLGVDDPGIGRLMLFDALGDAVSERHPVTGVFFP